MINMNQNTWILWLSKARSRPVWPAVTAITCVAVLVIVPLIIIALTAIVIGLAIYIVLTAAASLIDTLRGLTGPRSSSNDTASTHPQQPDTLSPSWHDTDAQGANDAGRQNVRVIRR